MVHHWLGVAALELVLTFLQHCGLAEEKKYSKVLHYCCSCSMSRTDLKTITTSSRPANRVVQKNRGGEVGWFVCVCVCVCASVCVYVSRRTLYIFAKSSYGDSRLHTRSQNCYS